jgi:hypothetical protein
MDLIKLDKAIKDQKVLTAFKDGVADGLLYGVKDAKQLHIITISKAMILV